MITIRTTCSLQLAILTKLLLYWRGAQETRAKMSATKLGKYTIEITDHDTNEITAFDTKSAAATYLGISIRTLGRWASDPTAIRVTKSNSRVSVSIISI